MAAPGVDRNRGTESIMTRPEVASTSGVMTEAQPIIAPTLTHLGAFDFWPASASRIQGLGGQVADPDPAYAFHTRYVDVGTGVVRCQIRFENLTATLGMISIRVNGMPPGERARAESVRVWSAPLSGIAESQGVIEVSFQASAGSRYAVLGQIFDETDAAASDMAVVLETTPQSQDEIEARASTRKSIFGRRMFRRAKRMFVSQPATLADPVSQGCTAAQLDEPVFEEWMAALGLPATHGSKQWEFAYILRVLQRYGMLRPGSRGIGFGIGRERLPALMAARGCSILATDLPSTDPRAEEWRAANQFSGSVEALRYPDLCADDVFDRQVSFRAIDMARLDLKLNGFDFCWSAGALEHLGSIEAGLSFIRDSVNCLTFGGLAVHTTAFNVSSNVDTIDHSGKVLLRRQDLEKVAVDLVSRGHYVAQFNYDPGNKPLDAMVDTPPYSGGHLKVRVEDYVATAFGIIVRRGDR